MNVSTRRRALGDLETLERLRRIEEDASLRELQRGRKDLEDEQGRLEEVRDRRLRAAALAKELRERGASASVGQEEGGLLRQLAFIDVLRGDEAQRADHVARRRDRWDELEQMYEKARARRRVVESLRERRARELEELRLRRLERGTQPGRPGRFDGRADGDGDE